MEFRGFGHDMISCFPHQIYLRLHILLNKGDVSIAPDIHKQSAQSNYYRMLLSELGTSGGSLVV